MIKEEKYEKIIWSLRDVARGRVILDDYKTILAASLTVAWSVCKNKVTEVKNLNSIEDDICKTIDIIEEENQGLHNAIDNLLIKSIQNKKDVIQLIKNIIENLYNIEVFNLEDIKNLINYLVMEMDFGKGKKKSISITPDVIKELMIEIIEPRENMKVVDYFSGTGSILLKVNKSYKDYNISLYGEEINNEAYLLSEIILRVNEVSNYNILNKDVYDFKNTEKNSFDYVLMDSPFSMSASRQLEQNEVFAYGMPNKTRVDWGSYQLALYTLKDKGKAIVTAPTGALYRTSDKKIRKAIIEDDKIESIIQLPNGLYTNTNIPTSVIVFNNSKNSIKKNKIIFIDASNESIRENRRQNTISKETIKKIINCIDENKEIEGFSVIEDISNISVNDYNLNSNVYINDRVIKNKLGKSKLLNEVAEIMSGVQLNKEDMKSLKKDSTHYYLNVKSIEDGEIIYDEEEKIRDKKDDWYGKYAIKAGDIIMTTRGTTNKMAIVPEDYKDSFISNNLSIIRVNQKKYNPYVLLKYLESKVGKLVLENISSGSTVMVIGANNLSNIEIPDYDSGTLESIGDRIKDNELQYNKKLNELNKKFEKENQEIINQLKLD